MLINFFMLDWRHHKAYYSNKHSQQHFQERERKKRVIFKKKRFLNSVAWETV